MKKKIGGRTVVRKAPAVLHRFGNRIWGKTNFGGKRSWKINGRIYGRKRIVGTYRAKGYLDDGFGTLYLEQKPNGILDGYWSGYGNVLKNVLTGRYLFKRQSENFKIRDANKSDFASVIKMSDLELGKGYVTEVLLNEVLDESKSTFCLVAYDLKTKRIVGFGLGKKIKYTEIKDIFHGKDLPEFKFEDEIGFLKAFVVEESFQKIGIGTMLVNSVLSKLSLEGVQKFISPAKKSKGVVPIASIYEKNNFKIDREIPNYWNEGNINDDFICPVCGNPCHCSCVIYIKI